MSNNIRGSNFENTQLIDEILTTLVTYKTERKNKQMEKQRLF